MLLINFVNLHRVASFSGGSASQLPLTASKRKIWGVIGTIRLLACRYLIVITEAEWIGTIARQQIYKIISTDVIPYSKSALHLNEKQIQINTTYLEMIKFALAMPHYYFSYTYDLSHTMQRLHNTLPEFLEVSPKVIIVLQIKKLQYYKTNLTIYQMLVATKILIS